MNNLPLTRTRQTALVLLRTLIAVASRAQGPVGSASESRAADPAGAGKGVGAAPGGSDRLAAHKYEMGGFCGAVRTGAKTSIEIKA